MTFFVHPSQLGDSDQHRQQWRKMRERERERERWKREVVEDSQSYKGRKNLNDCVLENSDLTPSEEAPVEEKQISSFVSSERSRPTVLQATV